MFQVKSVCFIDMILNITVGNWQTCARLLNHRISGSIFPHVQDLIKQKDRSVSHILRELKVLNIIDESAISGKRDFKNL